MIRNSFIFLERFGRQREQHLWQQGIIDWKVFLEKKHIQGIPTLKKQYYNQKIKEAAQALQEGNSSWFVGKLPAKEMWRLYGYFKDDCGFLDIETDQRGMVTVVGVSNYYETKTFVRGFHLEKEALLKALSLFKLLITFNGAAFDLPKLRKQFSLDFNIPHIDLKPLCVNLGLKGGLKEVEKRLNLKRPAHLYGNPVDLWKAFHASGDREYLDLLVDYNKEDCENLKWIMDRAYQEIRRKVFI